MCTRARRPFLERRPGKRDLLCCTAGVNLSAVGQATEPRCAACPAVGTHPRREEQQVWPVQTSSDTWRERVC